MPRHKNQVSFDPYTETKYFSTPTQKQAISDPDTEFNSQIQSTALKSGQFRPRTQKSSERRSPTQNLSSFRSTNETKLISIPMLNSVKLWRLDTNNTVNIDPDTRNMSLSTEVKSDPYADNVSSSIPHTEIETISTTNSKI